MTSCCDFLFLVAIMLVVFCFHRFQFYVATSFAAHFFSSSCNLSSLLQTNFLLFSFAPGRDLKLMSQLQFMLFSSFSCRDLNEWLRHRLRSLIIKWSQLQLLVKTLFGFFPGCYLFSVLKLLMWLQLHFFC